MPPVITFVAQAVFNGLISIGVGSIGVYSTWVVANVVAYSAVAFGMQAISKALAPKLPKGSLQSGSPMQLTRDPNPVARILYGRERVSGPIIFATTTGSSNEYLHLVVPIACHEIDAIEDTVFINDEQVTLSGGAATGKYAGFFWLNKHLGAADQLADADLVAAAPSYWTSNHRGRGIAYFYAKLKFDQEKFPGGIPNISVIARGMRLHDPRTGTTAWSRNPALAVRNYLLDSDYGLGCFASEVDDTAKIAAANACDEAVALSGGGTEERYALSGTFETTATPADILEAMVSACAGAMPYQSGRWRLSAGVWTAPVGAVLTADDFAGPINIVPQVGQDEMVNCVKGTFRNPADNWQERPLPPVTDAGYIAADNGIEAWADLSLHFTPSASMAQRIFKIHLQRSRREMTVETSLKFFAWKYGVGDVISITFAPLGWVAKTFIISKIALDVSPEGGLVVPVTLRETDSGVYSWTTEEAPVPPAPATFLPDPFSAAAPSALSLAAAGNNAADGTYLPSIVATWVAPADVGVTQGGWIEVQAKRAIDSNWSDHPPVPGSTTRTELLGVVAGVSYDVRIRSRSHFGAASAWITVTGFAVPGKAAGPGSVSSITLSKEDVPLKTYASTGVRLYGCRISWAAPADPDVAAYEIKATLTDSDSAIDYSWCDTIANGIARVPANQLSVVFYQVSLAAGYVRVRAINRSGVAGAWAVGASGHRNIYGDSKYIQPGGDMAEKNASSLPAITAAAVSRTSGAGGGSYRVVHVLSSAPGSGDGVDGDIAVW